MAAQDEAHQAKLDRLRAALEAGERSGFAEDFAMDRLRAELDEEAKSSRGTAVVLQSKTVEQ
jgi:hypothetical protein